MQLDLDPRELLIVPDGRSVITHSERDEPEIMGSLGKVELIPPTRCGDLESRRGKLVFERFKMGLVVVPILARLADGVVVSIGG